MKAIKVWLCILALSVSGAAFARNVVPVVNYAAVSAVPASAQPLTVDQVKQIIRKVGETKKWTITDQGNNQLLGSYSWNGGKHTIVVEFNCTAEGYSATYFNSINMKYEVVNGVPMIHPHYNRFVSEFNDAVRFEMTMR